MMLYRSNFFVPIPSVYREKELGNTVDGLAVRVEPCTAAIMARSENAGTIHTWAQQTYPSGELSSLIMAISSSVGRKECVLEILLPRAAIPLYMRPLDPVRKIQRYLLKTTEPYEASAVMSQCCLCMRR